MGPCWTSSVRQVVPPKTFCYYHCCTACRASSQLRFLREDLDRDRGLRRDSATERIWGLWRDSPRRDRGSWRVVACEIPCPVGNAQSPGVRALRGVLQPTGPLHSSYEEFTRLDTYVHAYANGYVYSWICTRTCKHVQARTHACMHAPVYVPCGPPGLFFRPQGPKNRPFENNHMNVCKYGFRLQTNAKLRV